MDGGWGALLGTRCSNRPCPGCGAAQLQEAGEGTQVLGTGGLLGLLCTCAGSTRTCSTMFSVPTRDLHVPTPLSWEPQLQQGVSLGNSVILGT